MDIVQALLHSGDDPQNGLLSAIRGRHSDIVRLLLESGATPGPDHEKAINALSKKKKKEMGLL